MNKTSKNFEYHEMHKHTCNGNTRRVERRVEKKCLKK